MFSLQPSKSSEWVQNTLLIWLDFLQQSSRLLLCMQEDESVWFQVPISTQQMFLIQGFFGVAFN